MKTLFYYDSIFNRKKKSKSNFSVTVFALTIIIMTMGVIGCGKKIDAMTDEEIRNIFVDYVTDNYPECSFTDYSVEINSRSISDDKKSEYADVCVNASNDIVSMNVNYSGYFYVDPNKEWQIGNIQVLDGYYEVLKSVITEDDARTYIDKEITGDYHEITLYEHQLELGDRKDIYVFNAKTTETETTFKDGMFIDCEVEVDRTIKVIFSFGLYSGWKFSDVKIYGEGIVNLGADSGIMVTCDPTEFYR